MQSVQSSTEMLPDTLEYLPAAQSTQSEGSSFHVAPLNAAQPGTQEPKQSHGPEKLHDARRKRTKRERQFFHAVAHERKLRAR